MADSKKSESVPIRVADFLSRSIQAPSVVMNPETSEPYLEPARYTFSGPHAEEFERIARGASAASGIVPTPEDLTAQAMAQLQAAAQQEGG